MKHITAPFFNPQINGKLERYHRIAKASVNLFIYHISEALSDAIDSFVDHYSYRRYTRPWKMRPQWLWGAKGSDTSQERGYETPESNPEEIGKSEHCLESESSRTAHS